MITEHYIIILLSVLVVVFLYTTFNLLRKNEKYEDLTEGYRVFILRFQQQVKESDKRIKEIDSKGTFKSDDEVGYFFNELKKIQDSLTNFRVEE
ncbi:hypothetical protein N9F16_00895 [bacterium]|jgi:hypothetical protein|nr:hypothetical protein [bacterium]|tara:strand:- start:271 stop:552 length:282 start_codon:yes stop_codon:yes gene_type:complete